jgi:hypothetical protein
MQRARSAVKLPRSVACWQLLAVYCMIALGACSDNISIAGSAVPAAPAATIDHRLILIGDTGNPALPEEPVLEALTGVLSELPQRTTALFLGDNIYQRGLPALGAHDRKAKERVLDAQLRTVTAAGASAVFLPGNHDWASRGWVRSDDGWDTVRRQADYVNQGQHPGVEFAPAGGCPGPEVRDYGRHLRVVLLDTQWWLHNGPKPDSARDGCRFWREDDVIRALRALIDDSGERHLVVAAHHPPQSNGSHGGYFSWQDHLFPLTIYQSWLWLPLPVVGSIYPLSRQAGITPQDQSSKRYSAMLEALQQAFSGQLPLVFAGGHEHVLEVHEGEHARYVLVSGSGIFGHTTANTWREGTLYADDVSGFMQLDVLSDGKVRLGVLVVDADGSATEVFSMYLATDITG